MRRTLGLTLLWWSLVVATSGSGLACRTKVGNYAGRWECASGGDKFFEIEAILPLLLQRHRGKAFLVSDESGKIYPASVDDKGKLVLDGVPSRGSLPLRISSSRSEIICPGCECSRYAKMTYLERILGKVHTTRDEEAQKQTVADIESIGTAMFIWLTDQVGAGAAGQSQAESRIMDLGTYPRISHQELEKLLVPHYLQTLSETDGWGHPYEFYLNAEHPLASQVMSIRSPGRDGKFSADDYSAGQFPRDRLDEDIVWSDGFFVRSPVEP